MDSPSSGGRGYMCPQCGVLSGADRCHHCGRGPVPQLIALAEVDGTLHLREQEIGHLNRQLAEATAQVDSLRRRRHELATELTRMREDAQRRSAAAAPPAADARAEAAIPAPPGPTTPLDKPRAAPEPAAGEQPNPPAATVPETSTRSVQNVLLTLGGVLSAAAIIVFTAVAWASFGGPGRAVILVAITAALMVVPPWIVRRGLNATAETIAGLAILMLSCDALALYLLNLFPSSADGPVIAEPATRDLGGSIVTAFTSGIHAPGLAIGIIVITGIALAYRVVTRMIVPGYALAGLGIAGACLAVVQSSSVLGTALLVVTAGGQALATRLVRDFPAKRGRRADRILAQLCASIAAAGLLVSTLLGFGNAASGYTLLAFTALAALLLLVARRLPTDLCNGPVWTLRVAMWLSGAIAGALTLIVVLRWLLLAMPVWHAAPDVPRWTMDPSLPISWRLTLTLAILTATGAARLQGRKRHHAVIVGAVLTVLTIPAALALPWSTSALLLAGIAVIAAAAATAVRHDEPARGLLSCALPIGLTAIALSLGSAGMTLAVLAGFAVCLAVLAPVPLPRGRAAHGGLLASGSLWTFMSAVPVACHQLGLAATHITALTAILAAATALLGAFTLTRETSASTRIFVSHTAFGFFAATATLTATALLLTLFVPAPPFVAMAAITAVPLYVVAAGFLVTTLAVPTPAAGTTMSSGAVESADVERVRRVSTGLATIGLLGAAGAYWSLWVPADTLPGYIVLALAVAAVCRVLPRGIGDGPVWGARTVAGLGCAFAGAAAVSTIPALFVLTEPLPWLDWRTPGLLGVAGLACLVLLPLGWRRFGATTICTLGILAVPVAWVVPWWTGAVIFGAVAAGYGVWSVFAARPAAVWIRGLVALGFAGYGLAAAALHPAAPTRQAGYAAAAIVGGALIAACVLIAVVAYTRRRPVGGCAVALGIVLMPGSTLLAGLAAGLPAETNRISVMTTACMGLLIAAALRIGASGYLRFATMVVPPVAVACARGGLPAEQSPMYIAVAGLIGVGAAMLMLPDRTAATVRTALSSVAIVATMVKVLPLSIATLAFPYGWLSAVWTGRPPDSTLDGLAPWSGLPAVVSQADGWDLSVLVVGATTIVLAVFGLAGRGWATGAAFAALAVTIPAIPVVFNLPWPSLPFVALAIAVAAYLLSTHLRFPAQQLSILVAVAITCAGAGLSASLATQVTTLVALFVGCAGTLSGGLLGASPARRAVGWLLSAPALAGLTTAAVLAAGLPGSRVAFGGVMVAALFLALASARTAVTGVSTWAVEVGGHGTALYAVVAAMAGAATATPTAVVLVIYGALLGLLAVRAGTTGETGRPLATKPWYAAGSVAAAFAAYWLLLAAARVSIIEVYTVPFALATLLGGWMELRRRERLRSWTAYGPGLCLLLLPPLAQILLTEDEPLRRLGLGVAGIAILLLGTWRRSQAPVVVAAVLLTVQACYEITLLWTLVPSWVPLALGGVLLLSLGATFEKRRRDLRRLRGAIATMR